MNFRHEWKHEISYPDVLALRSRFMAVMDPDIHAMNGKYEIRSLYFDNLQDKALREKLDGVNDREKFRLRYYNGDTSFILLEKKRKWNGLCRKEQVPVSYEEVQAILEGSLWARAADDKKHENISEAISGTEKVGYGIASVDDGRELLGELYSKMAFQGLRPRTIVDYTREPFVYAPGNVRVTLDYNIRTGMTGTDFLNPACITIPAGDAPAILEVKWDEFLPSVIRDIVQVPGTHTSAFSKYAACRIYG